MSAKRTRFRQYFLDDIPVQGWYEVLADRSHDQALIETWIVDCLKGQWSVDWMHGEDRSSSKRERDTIRFLFEDIEDATLALTFWG